MAAVRTPATSASARATLVALGVVVAGVLPVHLTGALAPRIQDDLGFGDATLGLVVAVFFGVSAATTAAGGALTDRTGPRRALRGATAVSLVALVVIGSAADDVTILVVGLAVAAIGNAIAQPGANVLVTRGVRPGRQGVALGTKQAAIAVSTGAAGVFAAVFGETWRPAFLLAAGVALTVLVAVPAVGPAARHKAAAGLRGRPGVTEAWVTGAAGAAAVSSIGVFVVRTGEEAGLHPATAALVQATGSVVLVIARIGWGHLADRGRIDPLAHVVRLLAVGTIGYLLLATGTPLGVMAGAAVAFGAGWSWPGLVFLGLVRAAPDRPGAMSGLAQSGMFTGAVVGPLVFGVLAERVAFAAAWGWSATCGLVAAAAAARLSRRLGGTAARR